MKIYFENTISIVTTKAEVLCNELFIYCAYVSTLQSDVVVVSEY